LSEVEKMKLSIIIVSYNVCSDLIHCLDEISRQISRVDTEVIVVDNHSSDSTTARIREQHPEVRLLEQSSNLGFSKANNVGIDESKGEYLMLLNPDTLPLPGFFEKLMETLDQNPDCGAAGPRSYWDMEKKFLISSLKTPSPGLLYLVHSRLNSLLFIQKCFESQWETDWNYWLKGPETFEVPAIGGAYMMLRRTALESIGGLLDEQFFLGYEDVDLSSNLKKRGWKLLCNPEAEIVHYYGASKRAVPEYLEYCTSWHAGPGRYIAKHFGTFMAAFFSLCLVLENCLKTFKVRRKTRKEDVEIEGETGKIVLSWPKTGETGSFLLEIATSPTFYDKFGVFVTDSELVLGESTLKSLSPGVYYFRIIRMPPSKSSILYQSQFEYSEKQASHLLK